MELHRCKQWWTRLALIAMGSYLALCVGICRADYSQHDAVKAFVDEMVTDHQFNRQALNLWLTAAEKQQKILDAIARPAEKTKPWYEYRKIFLTEDRTQKGVAFWRENQTALARAEKDYGVPAEMIVAIIGVETRSGGFMGNYRVMDALSTLAFDYPPRSTFFRKELVHFLLLAREQQQDPLTLTGSYAGAMGYGQFMPSSYRSYAVDFDGDDLVDIWHNPVDAIGSVANYFHRHGWQPGQPVVSRVKVSKGYDKNVANKTLKPEQSVAELNKLGFVPLARFSPKADATIVELEQDSGPEFWMGLTNFYVITRYNHSRMYAMAAYQLSQDIKLAFDKQAFDKK